MKGRSSRKFKTEEFSRVDRVADLIQRELAQLIQYEIKDPRLHQLITVAAVKVTRDLGHAKVYVTLLEGEEKAKEAIKILNHAAGYLRTQLAHRVQLRIVPELLFVYDKSIIEGNRLSSLIDSAMKRTDDDNATE